jgi:hypothetical protein
MNDQKVQVTINLVNGLLGYLGSRPYVEVADLILAIREQVTPQLPVPEVPQAQQAQQVQ